MSATPTTPEAAPHSYAQFIIKSRWFVPFFVLAIVVAAVIGAQNLYFATSYRVFFGPDNPQLQAFERLQNVYAKDDNVLIMLESDSGSVFNQETFSIIHELTEKSWQIPFSTRVDSITNFQHSVGTEDELIVGDLIPIEQSFSEAEIKHIQNVALQEPLLIHRLVSPSGDATAINVTIELPGKSPDEVTTIANYVRAMAQEVEQAHPDIHIALSGMVMLNNAFPEASMNDMSTLTLSMYGIIILLTVVFTRSIAGTFATLCVIGLSTMTAMGIAGHAHLGLTPVSVMAPTVIMTLAVADCIHIIVTYRDRLQQGFEKYAAIRDSIRVNLGPVFVTSVTTAIGFLSLNFSDAPPYHDYGNITAIGVMFAFLFSVTLLPALLAILPHKKPALIDQEQDFFAKLARNIIPHRGKYFLATATIGIGLAICIPLIQLDDRFVQYFDESIEFRQDTDRLNEKLTGVYNVSYDLESGDTEGITSPLYLKTLDHFTVWLRQQPEVIHVNSVADIFKRINKNMNNDVTSFYRMPESKELASQYLLLYEMSLPFGLDLTTLINIDKSASKVTATLMDLSTTQMRDFEERSNAWISKHGQGIFEGIGASPSIMFSHISKRNIDAMVSGTVLSLVLITAVLMLAMKSMRFGLLSLIPNVLPIVMGFGLWALLVGSIGMAVATIAGLTLGIVVDDTVHIISKYLRARREGYSAEESVVKAYTAVGRALLITSLVLICGFLIMTQSTFRMNWSLGLLSSITIFCALIADLLMLPGLLIGGEKLLNFNKQDELSSSNDNAIAAAS